LPATSADPRAGKKSDARNGPVALLGGTRRRLTTIKKKVDHEFLAEKKYGSSPEDDFRTRSAPPRGRQGRSRKAKVKAKDLAATFDARGPLCRRGDIVDGLQRSRLPNRGFFFARNQLQRHP